MATCSSPPNRSVRKCGLGAHPQTMWFKHVTPENWLFVSAVWSHVVKFCIVFKLESKSTISSMPKWTTLVPVRRLALQEPTVVGWGSAQELSLRDSRPMPSWIPSRNFSELDTIMVPQWGKEWQYHHGIVADDSDIWSPFRWVSK